LKNPVHMFVKCTVHLVLKSCILVPENGLCDLNARHAFKKLFFFVMYCNSSVNIGNALLAGGLLNIYKVLQLRPSHVL